MFKVGDKVKVVDQGIAMKGEFTVDALNGDWYGVQRFEIADANGDLFGVLESQIDYV